MTVTIYDVARTARVSLATVSRVLNNNINVKPQTRQKVLAVIEQLGFRPNAVARGLASKKTTTIGVVIPDISRAVLPDVVRGIEKLNKNQNKKKQKKKKKNKKQKPKKKKTRQNKKTNKQKN